MALTSTQVSEAATKFKEVEKALAQVIVGQKALLKSLQIALLANGHILLEGLPGLAKTLSVTTFADVIDCEFKRVQFTPDLLPADLIGTTIFNPKEGTFSVQKGPIFTNILLADEINRAPAKVQSALLEAMQERQVTISGTTFKTKNPYLVLATQNPIEHEGTYPLPEAQIDRFMLKIKIGYPSMKEEEEILRRRALLEIDAKPQKVLTIDEILQIRKLVDQIYVDPKIIRYVLDIVFATREPEKFGLPIRHLIAYGASPRATIFLILAAKAHALLDGREFTTPFDIQQMSFDVMRHRIKTSYEAEAEEITSDRLIEQILEKIPAP